MMRLGFPQSDSKSDPKAFERGKGALVFIIKASDTNLLLTKNYSEISVSEKL